MEVGQVILFDGVCNLCNRLVQFIIQHDRSEKFLFAAQQSNAGQKLLQQFEVPENSYLIVIKTGRQQIITESDAVLEIFRQLGGGWVLLYMLIIVPKFIRDSFYKFIARNRYRWFGKRDSCMMPLPGLEKRFLN